MGFQNSADRIKFLMEESNYGERFVISEKKQSKYKVTKGVQGDTNKYRVVSVRNPIFGNGYSTGHITDLSTDAKAHFRKVAGLADTDEIKSVDVIKNNKRKQSAIVTVGPKGSDITFGEPTVTNWVWKEGNKTFSASLTKKFNDSIAAAKKRLGIVAESLSFSTILKEEYQLLNEEIIDFTQELQNAGGSQEGHSYTYDTETKQAFKWKGAAGVGDTTPKPDTEPTKPDPEELKKDVAFLVSEIGAVMSVVSAEEMKRAKDIVGGRIKDGSICQLLKMYKDSEGDTLLDDVDEVSSYDKHSELYKIREELKKTLSGVVCEGKAEEGGAEEQKTEAGEHKQALTFIAKAGENYKII